MNKRRAGEREKGWTNALLNGKILAIPGTAFVVQLFSRRETLSAGNPASGKLHRRHRNVGLSLTRGKGLKLNDEVNVRFLRDFEMQCARESRRARAFDALLVVSSRSRYFFPLPPSRRPFFHLILRSSPSPRVFSLDKLAAVGNKTRSLFISDLLSERNRKNEFVEMRQSAPCNFARSSSVAGDRFDCG